MIAVANTLTDSHTDKLILNPDLMMHCGIPSRPSPHTSDTYAMKWAEQEHVRELGAYLEVRVLESDQYNY